MPALPLDTAGQYVAAAYLVFLALILIYVAIMASKLVRIGREVGEINELLDRRAEANAAGAFVPLNFIAVRLAQAVIHPRVFATADGGLPAKMQLAFTVCLLGMALLYVTLWRYEMAAKQASWSLRSLKRRLGGDEAVAARGRSAAPSLPVT